MSVVVDEDGEDAVEEREGISPARRPAVMARRQAETLAWYPSGLRVR